MPCLRTVGGFPYKTPTGGWLLRHVSIPHEESPPHMTSFRPARGVSASHDKFSSRTRSLLRASDNLLVRMSSFRLRPRRGLHKKIGTRRPGPTRTWRHPDAWAPSQQRVGRQFPTPCKRTSWQHAWASASDKGCNAALFCRVSPDAPSRLTPRHANPVRGTRVPLQLALAYD
jgi:hypothetical protein